MLNNTLVKICEGENELISITICDVKPGQDETVYSQMEKLRSNQTVTPLVIGRLFEEADIMLLLHSTNMESLDDYLIKNVRSIQNIQELIVIPIYEFKLLSSFNFMIEPTTEETTEPTSFEPEELLFFMAKIDVAPTKDHAVYNNILSIKPTNNAIPLMTGHTFHSKEFDLVLFFLAKNLENAWKFVKTLRLIEGVWDTEVNLIAHFEGLTTLKRFKELVSKTSAQGSYRHKGGKKKIAK